MSNRKRGEFVIESPDGCMFFLVRDGDLLDKAIKRVEYGMVHYHSLLTGNLFFSQNQWMDYWVSKTQERNKDVEK